METGWSHPRRYDRDRRWAFLLISQPACHHHHHHAAAAAAAAAALEEGADVRGSAPGAYCALRQTPVPSGDAVLCGS